jgi:hypothetical protein
MLLTWMPHAAALHLRYYDAAAASNTCDFGARSNCPAWPAQVGAVFDVRPKSLTWPEMSRRLGVQYAPSAPGLAVQCRQCQHRWCLPRQPLFTEVYSVLNYGKFGVNHAKHQEQLI